MDMFSGMSISASALRAQRVKQNVIASNLANAETTRGADGGPYKRQFVVLREAKNDPEKRFVFGEDRMQGFTTHPDHMPIPEDGLPIAKDRVGSGVEVAAIEQDTAAPRLVYDPSHPDANQEGYVAMPNVNPVQEMTDMITATRSYEASVTAMNSAKAMLMKALEL
ncbi:MAG TPA: flagellar basal body rod protein FlgC [Fibrobacteria bacterium]|nr:flagellar basal body rod protein FlgC [Fibrobacteria bacterium]